MTQPAPVPEQPVCRPAYGDMPATLAQLLDQFDAVKNAADEAKAKLDALVLSIKAEATGVLLKPDGTPYGAYEFTTPELAKPVKLTWTVSERFDTKGFRAANPAEAEKWTKAAGTWRLERKR